MLKREEWLVTTACLKKSQQRYWLHQNLKNGKPMIWFEREEKPAQPPKPVEIPPS